MNDNFCEACDGFGSAGLHTCPVCGGSGRSIAHFANYRSYLAHKQLITAARYMCDQLFHSGNHDVLWARVPFKMLREALRAVEEFES